MAVSITPDARFPGTVNVECDTCGCALFTNEKGAVEYLAEVRRFAETHEKTCRLGQLAVVPAQRRAGL